VAHPDVFALYLEWTVNEGMAAFTDAEAALGVLADEAALKAFMLSIDLNRREDVIAALENYEGDYPVEAVPSAITVLFNLLPSLPERPQGFFSTDARIVVTRVVLRLLRQLDGTDEVEQVVADVLPRIETLSSRFELVRLVGHMEGSGHSLVPEDVAARLETDLRQAVLAAPAVLLATEWDLLRLLYWTHRQGAEEATTLRTIDNPQLNGQILLTAKSEARSQSMDSRSVRREARLAWDVLIELYGSEDRLREVVGTLNASEPDSQLAEVAILAKRYLDGWRPKRF